MNIFIDFFGLKGQGGNTGIPYLGPGVFQLYGVFRLVFFFNCVLPIPAAIGFMNVLARSPLNLNSVKRWNLPSK